jgi:hypothetical protein
MGEEMTATGPEAQVRAVVSSFGQIGPQGLTETERLAAVDALEAVKGAAAAAQARLTAAAVVDREALGEDSRSVRADVALARRCSPTLADLGLTPFDGHPDWPGSEELGGRGCPHGCQEEEFHPAVPA